MPNLAIILAAGKGTRMQSSLPKCLHEVAGAPMIAHVIHNAQEAGFEDLAIVLGHGAQEMKAVIEAIDENISTALQSEQNGTAHAAMQVLDKIEQNTEITVVLYGDTPLIQAETLTALIAQAKATNGPVVLGFNPENPGRYGRLITEGKALLAIREAKDASVEELAITLCNSGVLACRSEILSKILPEIDNHNASGEYYLTDSIEIARKHGHEASFILGQEIEMQGVNTPLDLMEVNKSFQTLKRAQLMQSQVKMIAPETVYFHFDTVIGNDVEIEPNVVFAQGVTVENGVKIRAFSHIEGAHIGENSTIGPFARLRPGAELGEAVHIGNFVEIKNAQIHNGAKVNHLSYIGDAEIGQKTNIGAGTITCNYDGVFKHQTIIGEGAFIGSNSILVAPVKIGDHALTAAGSVITKNVENGELSLARAEQVNKPNLAIALMNKLRALKSRKEQEASKPH